MYRSGLYACGTLRSNRKGFPDDLKPFLKANQQERGDSVVRQKGNITVSVWRDNKPVTVVATNSDPTKQETVLRKNKDGTSRVVSCPEATQLCNMFMGGVDLSDQLRGYYHLRLKSRKFYKYIVWFLIDLTITNAYILCKHFTHLKITSTKAFRVGLAKELIGSYCSRKRVGRPSVQPARKRLRYSVHFPVKKVKAGGKGHRCHYCQTHLKCRRETVWYCNTCAVYLCHSGRDDDCFLAYHHKTHVE